MSTRVEYQHVFLSEHHMTLEQLESNSTSPSACPKRPQCFTYARAELHQFEIVSVIIELVRIVCIRFHNPTIKFLLGVFTYPSQTFLYLSEYLRHLFYCFLFCRQELRCTHTYTYVSHLFMEMKLFFLFYIFPMCRKTFHCLSTSLPLCCSVTHRGAKSKPCLLTA